MLLPHKPSSLAASHWTRGKLPEKADGVVSVRVGLHSISTPSERLEIVVGGGVRNLRLGNRGASSVLVAGDSGKVYEIAR